MILEVLAIAWIAKHFADRQPSEEVDIDDDEVLPEERPDEQVWTKTAKWSGEYATTGTGGDQVVWFLTMGIRYSDGTADFSDTTYIVIGNKNHTAFLRSNSDRGTVDIAKEYTGGTQDIQNAVVFSSLASAEARADELANPAPYDPNDPTSPQPQPEEDDDEPTQPSLPTRPDFGFGGFNQFSIGGL
jgi:hypothetical protein